MAVDESRLKAGVEARAEHLFDDGYRAEIADGTTVIVQNPTGTLYAVDIQRHTCTCPFFVKWNGRHSCKHLLGYPALLLQQQAYERLTITRYRKFYAVWDADGELIAVTVYRVGAESVRKRLSALALRNTACPCQKAAGNGTSAPCSS
jgi:predicted nucleic acid-binding Zn finger protein